MIVATLVLTAVGGVVGGPAGAMLGGLVGRAADGALLGRGRGREGPRLAELAVQTSSYGTPVPRVWGRMRVAGTVVWATDLKEARATSRGAKGQPATSSYSYSCSFAVLLSGRPVLRVERVWADGRLLRGAAGDLKVWTGFRLYRGTEDQPPDPLIASAEGVGRTSAMRGQAYAVFEDMALAEFGNRIPQMTFEIVADEGPVATAAILGELVPGAEARGAMMLDGYAASGSLRANADLLAGAGGLWAWEAGGALRFADRGAMLAAGVETLADLGTAAAAAGAHAAAPPVRTLAPADTVPRAVTVLHHDAARDYQAGLQRAVRPGAGWREERLELPAAIGPAAAKAVAADALARAEAGRVRRTVRTGAGALALMPGGAVRIAGEADLWRVDAVSVERMAGAAELVPLAAVVPATGASGGRPNLIPDRPVGRTALIVAELPPGDGAAAGGGPRLTVMASGGAGWRGAALLWSLDDGASWHDAGVAARSAITGVLETALAAAPEALFDQASAPVVRLDDPGAPLADADDAGLDAGANLMLLGDELVQFGIAEPLGGGRWRLGRLLRGRRGTTVAAHASATRLGLVEADATVAIDLPPGSVGGRARLAATGPGDGDRPAEAEATVTGASVLPPAPVHLRFASDAGGDGVLTWVRRGRGGWLDGADVPLGQERELYAVRLVRGGTALREAECERPGLSVTAAERAGGPLTAEVRQHGTAGAGPAATIDF